MTPRKKKLSRRDIAVRAREEWLGAGAQEAAASLHEELVSGSAKQHHAKFGFFTEFREMRPPRYQTSFDNCSEPARQSHDATRLDSPFKFASFASQNAGLSRPGQTTVARLSSMTPGIL